MHRFRSRRALGATVVALGTVVLGVTVPASGAGRAPGSTTFTLTAIGKTRPCLAPAGKTPTATVNVTRGSRNDTLTINVKNVKPNLAFDLFTAEKTPLKADGTANSSFTNFGLVWYQSDLQADGSGNASVQIKTILLDQIFGFDPAKSLGPTNTFHVGIWFNDPATARPCGFTGVTPFNGEHAAGPVAMISKPSAATGLGPLCTQPFVSGGTWRCHP